MRVLIDTNILISAVLFPGSTPDRAYRRAVSDPHHGMLCEQNIDELWRIFNRKFPDKLRALESFLAAALPALEIIPTPETETDMEHRIRDVMDRPILRAAMYAHADVILTGDKDFLESGITDPRILTAAAFLEIGTA